MYVQNFVGKPIRTLRRWNRVRTVYNGNTESSDQLRNNNLYIIFVHSVGFYCLSQRDANFL